MAKASGGKGGSGKAGSMVKPGDGAKGSKGAGKPVSKDAVAAPSPSKTKGK